MQRWLGLDSLPADWGPCVVTIGVFDGVHRGHADIVGRAVAEARQRGIPSVLVTFVPHPAEVVRPGSHPPVLTTIERRAELVEGLGVDVFCALPFTYEFSQLPPEDFAHAILVDRLDAAAVIVGENFRFGHKAAGTVAVMQELGEKYGFRAEGVELLTDGSTVLSATFVRTCIERGDVAAAAHALGRPHRVDGIVERGDERGRELGYPTANLHTTQWAAIPADGVYAGRVVRLDADGRTLDAPPLGTAAAISIGTNPTFDGAERRVEAYVLDRTDLDLYEQVVVLELVERLRPTLRFDSIDDLVVHMHADVDRARAILGDGSGGSTPDVSPPPSA